MRRADVAVVTANLGGYDDLVPHVPQDIDTDFFYFTDDLSLQPNGWKVVHQKRNGHPCLAAKRYKFLPSVPHRYVVWIDANIQIASKSFVREALTYIEDGVALHRHPFRDCIYAEAVETILTPKYDHLPIAEQVRHYHREDAYHPHSGLYACGVIAWDTKHPNSHRLGKAWMHECEKWGFQDQLSFPVVCKRLGIQPGVFPHHQYASPWFKVLPHR